MACNDYNQAVNTDIGGNNIGAIGDNYAAEPTVYIAHCSHCDHGVYLMEHEPANCPCCGSRMTRTKGGAPVRGLSQWQRREMNDSRERHFVLLQKNQVQGQLLQTASQQAQGNVWGAGSLEILQDQMNRAAQAQAEQLAKLQQSPPPAWIGNECKIKTPQVVGKKEQERAVTHELMDALDYLIQDVLENAKRYPQIEAIARNYAMRRAVAAMQHGRAML